MFSSYDKFLTLLTPNFKCVFLLPDNCKINIYWGIAGHYFEVSGDGSESSTTRTAQLMGPEITSTIPEQCVIFYYYIDGRSSEFSLYLLCANKLEVPINY